MADNKPAYVMSKSLGSSVVGFFDGVDTQYSPVLGRRTVLAGGGLQVAQVLVSNPVDGGLIWKHALQTRWERFDAVPPPPLP